MSIRILLVDDRRSDRFMIRKRLGEMGYSEIEEACNAEEAMSRAEATRPDLLLMDTQMPPGMPGDVACRQIRQRDYGQKMAIIGTSTNPYAARWKAAGADDFIDKTDLIEAFNKEATETRIRDAVSKYQPK